MSSTNFQINWDSLNSGGLDIASSTSFILQDTIGEQGSGLSSSASFQVRGGYRQAEGAPVLEFQIGTQENATRAAYSNFNFVGNSATLGTVVDFSIGDFIGVVENEGVNQRVAVGKILSIIGNVVTVDQWDGDGAAIAASPSGGDDVVYRLNGDAAELGTLSTTRGATTMTYTSVVSGVAQGYVVSVYADGDLRSSANTIDAVADAAVMVGTEEYGAQVTGANATGTGMDFPLTVTSRAVQESAAVASTERSALIYKAAISPITQPGSYAQQVVYTLTARF